MKVDSFRDWLRERGCSFDQTERDRGIGHAEVTVRRADKRVTMPLGGTHKDLDPEDLIRITKELGLDPAELPRERDRW